MLEVLFGIKCKKKCSRKKIMPKKVLALSVRDQVGRDGLQHSRPTRKHKFRILCPVFGESRFPGNSQIPDPVNIYIVSRFPRHFLVKSRIPKIPLQTLLGATQVFINQRRISFSIKSALYLRLYVHFAKEKANLLNTFQQNVITGVSFGRI